MAVEQWDRTWSRLSDYRGKKKVMLLFYPMDFSPTCTTEHCTFGPAFDRLFLEYMIRHHEGALKMVADLLATPRAAQDVDVSVLANDVETTQTADFAPIYPASEDAARAAATTATKIPRGPRYSSATRPTRGRPTKPAIRMGAESSGPIDSSQCSSAVLSTTSW
mgnify:CR=1 FL=1